MASERLPEINNLQANLKSNNHFLNYKAHFMVIFKFNYIKKSKRAQK